MGEFAETLRARIAARREARAPEARCANCSAFDTEGRKSGRGLCRRQPPAVIIVEGGIESEWPVVYSYDWCIEHVPGGPDAD